VTGKGHLALRCPHCGTRVPLVKKTASGNVYTYSGIQIRGTADEGDGSVQKSDSTLGAHFHVESVNYIVAECAECRKEFVVENFRKL